MSEQGPGADGGMAGEVPVGVPDAPAGGGETESLATAAPISPWRLALRRFLRRKPAVISVAVLGVIVVGAIFADWIAPFGAVEQNLDDILHSPDGTYLLGTDTLGRDNLSRILHGGRVSLLVGITVALIAGVVGTLIGILAGYYGGLIDATLMRLTDTLLALPGLMVVIIAARLLGDGVWDVVLVLSGIAWMTLARIVRGKVLTLKEQRVRGGGAGPRRAGPPDHAPPPAAEPRG